MLVEYCQCVDDTPMLVTDIMNKLFETLKVRFQILDWKDGEPGWRSSVCAPSHQCGPGSIPVRCHMCADFVIGSHLAARVFSGFSAFPSSTKTSISKFQSNHNGGLAWKPAKSDVPSSHIIVFYYVHLIFFLFTFFCRMLYRCSTRELVSWFLEQELFSLLDWRRSQRNI